MKIRGAHMTEHLRLHPNLAIPHAARAYVQTTRLSDYDEHDHAASVMSERAEYMTEHDVIETLLRHVRNNVTYLVRPLRKDIPYTGEAAAKITETKQMLLALTAIDATSDLPPWLKTAIDYQCEALDRLLSTK